MATDEADRLAQAMRNSIEAIEGRDDEIWRLTYTAADGPATFDPTQVANYLDSRPALNIYSPPKIRGSEATFDAHVALTADMASLATAIPVWVVVQGASGDTSWYLADIGGPMSRGEVQAERDAFVNRLLGDLPQPIEEALDPAEAGYRTGTKVVREITENPIRAIRQSAIPWWFWAGAAAVGALVVAPRALELVESVRG